MNILEKFINIGFREGKDGFWLFYPYGIFGKGYRVDPHLKRRIKKFLKYFYPLFILFVSLGLIVNFYVGLGILLLAGIAYFYTIREVLSDAEGPTEGLSYRAESINILHYLGIRTIFVLLIISLILLIGGVFYYQRNQSLAIMILIAFCIIALINWGYLIYLYYFS